MAETAYITSLGKFLPGPPIKNEQMEAVLGKIGGHASRLRKKILEQNQIHTRYYALDAEQRTTHQASEMAALAIRDALERSRVGLNEIELLTTGTSQADLLVPGFASMVHAELGNPPCEIGSLGGVCASGMAALKYAYLQLQTGAKSNSIACASELPSRLFKSSRYESQDRINQGKRLSFDAEFLRWMLSDGAGAAVLERSPGRVGNSLRIEWIESRSFANRFDVCMYSGANKQSDGSVGRTWLDYPSFEHAAAQGVLNLKQDTRMLDELVKVGVDYYFQLVEEGLIETATLDWFVGHYSSHIFKGRIVELLKSAGVQIPEEKWFSNLYSRGNTGSASIYLLLEELLGSSRLTPGQRVLCMVPESGRFTVAYMLLTVVGETDGASVSAQRLPASPAPAPALNIGSDPLRQSLVRQLTRVWIDFEASLKKVPIIDKLERGQLTREDYRTLLVNLRQQVVEGARWIARAASNIEIERFNQRSSFLSHAREEHRDFQMLERDYVAVGGELQTILNSPKNVGSEALSAWMFQRASQPNPFDLLGAMFIIEGLGARLAHRWGTRIDEQLGLNGQGVSFLLYHGKNDENHMQRLEDAAQSDLLTPEVAERIVKTAKVTARLYRLQLEELGNC